MKKPSKCYICYGICYCDYTHLIKFLHSNQNLNSEESKHTEVSDVALPSTNLGTNKLLELRTPTSTPKKLKGDNGY
jgi:hypothetical protein